MDETSFPVKSEVLGWNSAVDAVVLRLEGLIEDIRFIKNNYTIVISVKFRVRNWNTTSKKTNVSGTPNSKKMGPYKVGKNQYSCILLPMKQTYDQTFSFVLCSCLVYK